MRLLSLRPILILRGVHFPTFFIIKNVKYGSKVVTIKYHETELLVMWSDKVHYRYNKIAPVDINTWELNQIDIITACVLGLPLVCCCMAVNAVCSSERHAQNCSQTDAISFPIRAVTMWKRASVSCGPCHRDNLTFCACLDLSSDVWPIVIL